MLVPWPPTGPLPLSLLIFVLELPSPRLQCLILSQAFEQTPGINPRAAVWFCRPGLGVRELWVSNHSSLVTLKVTGQETALDSVGVRAWKT